MNAANHSGAEAFVPEFGKIFALDSPALLEVVVKPLDLNGGQLVQGNISDSGDDVVFDVVGVVRFGVGADARFSIDPVSYTHLDVYKRQVMTLTSKLVYEQSPWKPSLARVAVSAFYDNRHGEPSDM